MSKMEEHIRFSKDLRAYYVEQLLPQHNAIYRLAFALTLNPKQAQRLTEFCYIDAVQDLDKLNKQEEPMQTMVTTLWQSYCKKTHKMTPDPNFPLAKALSYLAPEQRFILVTCDVLGLELKDLAKILNKSELDLSQELMTCRDQLLNKGLPLLSQMP